MVWASHLKPYMINIFEQRVQHLGVNNDFFFKFYEYSSFFFICLISLVKGTEADHEHHYYHFSNSSNNNIINIQGKQIDTKELHLKCYYLQ